MLWANRYFYQHYWNVSVKLSLNIWWEKFERIFFSVGLIMKFFFVNYLHMLITVSSLEPYSTSDGSKGLHIEEKYALLSKKIFQIIFSSFKSFWLFLDARFHYWTSILLLFLLSFDLMILFTIEGVSIYVFITSKFSTLIFSYSANERT